MSAIPTTIRAITARPGGMDLSTQGRVARRIARMLNGLSRAR